MSAPASGLTRRSVLTAAGTAGLLLATAPTAPAASADRRAGHRAGRVRLRLPRPTGTHRIGTTSLHLIDRSRRDPWTSPAAPRELMISLWYPARNAPDARRAPWLPPAATELYRRDAAASLRTSLDDVDFPVTHARRNAPVEARRRAHPVVLFSPGYGSFRALGTALVEDLASRGYVVVTIDHTHEAEFVEFPGGRIVASRQPAEPTDEDHALALRVRCEDTRFVLDTLTALNAGDHRRPFRGALDLSRVGMFGHSFGGATAAETMARDRRIHAGVDLDGSIFGEVARTGLDRPFLLMASEGHGRDNDESWAEFWSHLRGWRRHLSLRDSGHMAYTDLSPLGRQLIRALPIPAPVVAALTNDIGTIDPARSVSAQRAYLAAFFDLHLRRRDSPLWSGPSPRHPEIEFVP
ncbi:alpha/beta hydrolase family protein [Thermomonospora umbrina]|uniref:Platelet-activating factor acetylhydrolase isoform II n=1 Tax=Thermomonospora umbrina TaxID=111806 RepID=A0A3D9SJN9_9ACTN|nr:lipase [Thermomonospora umbrina]REE96132.1 platelet-activating factor acetylhydrolase isoform II [Thermomonospora umbrina]